MTIEKRPIAHGAFESMLVSPSDGAPAAVLIFPTIMGRSGLEIGFAERLARLGYSALVADLYGRENIGKSREECREIMMGLLGDRPALQARLTAVLDVMWAQPGMESARIVAIGYCFGGLCALDLARTGADIKGAASFHGLFRPPENILEPQIRARVIAFHGWADPMVPPDQVVALAEEMTRAGADWQIHAYGRVMHGFTNPAAANPDGGVNYDEQADRRSWAALEDFLAECFG